MGSSQDIWNRFKKWCRLSILVQEGGEYVCKHILYTEMNVPKGGKEMYRHLKSYETSIKKSKMFPYQKKALLPVNEDIDTTKLDIALFTYIIQILDDPSKPNYPRIEELRFKRNELFHMKEDQRNMSELEFDDHWNEVSHLLTDLIATFDMSTLNRIKSDNLFSNPDQKEMLEAILFQDKLENILVNQNDKHKETEASMQELFRKRTELNKDLHEKLIKDNRANLDRMQVLIKDVFDEKTKLSQGCFEEKLKNILDFTEKITNDNQEQFRQMQILIEGLNEERTKISHDEFRKIYMLIIERFEVIRKDNQELQKIQYKDLCAEMKCIAEKHRLNDTDTLTAMPDINDPKCHQTRYEGLEFSVISHINDRFIAEKIPRYCRKNKRKVLLQLKKGQWLIDRDNVLLRSKEYFKQQLKGIIEKEVYSIPYVDDNSLHPNLETPFLTIMNTLKNWCYVNNQNDGEIKGLVICGYSLDSHLEFLKFPSSFLKNDCFSLNTEELHGEPDKLIIAYNPAEKVIFLIRKACTDNLKNEMKLSTNDVMKFVMLHFNVLKNSGVQVINLLVTDNEFDDPLVCESCRHQVISMESFTSSDQFQNWWEKKHEKFSVSLCYRNINRNFSEDFCAQLLLFLATHKIPRESQFDGMLPLKTDVLREQVEEANFLTYEHLRVIYSKVKHQMVFGWYDSGISTVAQKRAEVISSKLGSDEILCFICYDSKSQLLANKENKSEMKVVLNENFRNLSDIVKDLLVENENKQKIHLAVVEYDTEELNKTQTKELHEMFTRNEKLKDSYIFLACQPIQKKRTVEIMKKKYITQIDSKLYDKLCMQKEEIYYNKGNTLEINALIAFTANELENEITYCKLPCNNATDAKNLLMKRPRTQTETHDHSVTKPKLGKGKVGKDDVGKNKNCFKQITFDETFELCKMNDSASSTDRKIVKSGFKYIIKPSKSKLNVKLVKPSIVEIRYTELSKELMILDLKMILEQIICQKYRNQEDYDILKLCKSEKHVILHFDIQNDFPQYFNMVFQLMGKEQKVTNNYKEFIQDGDKTILICNYRAFRGLKNSSVIVVLQPSLYHLKFCVLECLSRATVLLDVIVLNMDHTHEGKSFETFEKIINKWKSLSKEKSLFSPCRFIDYGRQNGTDTNTAEKASLSKDIESIRKWFTESKSQPSYNEKDLVPNLARFYEFVQSSSICTNQNNIAGNSCITS